MTPFYYHSTHNVYCKKCRTQIAFWSMFDNFQYKDEYECCGRVWQKQDNYWKLKKTTFCGHYPDEDQIKEAGEGIPKKVTKKLTWCSIKNHTQYCEECAKKMNFKCPNCGKEIKLTRKA